MPARRRRERVGTWVAVTFLVVATAAAQVGVGAPWSGSAVPSGDGAGAALVTLAEAPGLRAAWAAASAVLDGPRSAEATPGLPTGAAAAPAASLRAAMAPLPGLPPALAPVLMTALELEAAVAAEPAGWSQSIRGRAALDGLLATVEALLDSHPPTVKVLPAGPSAVGAGERCAEPLTLPPGPAAIVAIGHEGPDCYPATSFLLTFDPGGDDVYPRAAAASTSGVSPRVSVTVDLAGDDLYLRSAQAFGGAALLVDQAGNDRYAMAVESHAYARLGGWALLADLGGDDTYGGGWLSGLALGYAEGDGSVGLLWDRAGNDRYALWGHLWYWAGIGAGADGGAGILVDGGGEDSYLSPLDSQGHADQGTGLFLDAGGDDVYRGGDHGTIHPALPSGRAVFADLGGTDLYAEFWDPAGPAIGEDNTHWGSGLTPPDRYARGFDCELHAQPASCLDGLP